MKNSTKLNALKAVLATAVLLTATTASAFSVTVGGVAGAPGTGLHSSQAWYMENTFDAANQFGTYTGGAVVSGSVSGQYAAPPSDTSKYMTVGANANQPSPITITLGALASYFGYFGGSPDTYNKVAFYSGSSLIAEFTGTQLAQAANLSPNGNQSIGEYWNFFAAGPTEYFNTIKLFSTSNAFETDNHAVNAVPLPAAAWLFGSALLGFAGFSNRRKS
ncbi:MAG: VPLPA-CTERM sorting domain-containing protein [Methylotenera sp.]|nr:VPLPA-CTERM sorting domain-containing protein [Methylotenera sp.]